VGTVRKEWLSVARMPEVGVFRRARTIILPAAAPTVLRGVRISIGTAWLVIAAAGVLGGTGIGYFVWNEWNNFSITNVITTILVIGVVGMILDQILARPTVPSVSPTESMADKSISSKALPSFFRCQMAARRPCSKTRMAVVRRCKSTIRPFVSSHRGRRHRLSFAQ
jgi:hypothetical protein